jgi:hypothetical protein
MQQPPTLGGSVGGLGFTAAFPYGEQSSLFRAMGDQPHPRYGNGLFLLQSFPISPPSDRKGIELALALNAEALAEQPSGYGFGSYVYRDSTIHFTSFLPNLIYKSGLLPNIYGAAAGRARQMSIRLMSRDWYTE